jgi:peptidoglycan/LPS O-acetylase OafA/YrhL
MTRPHFEKSRYIPELDGLRGVAILAVMLFHMQVRGVALGWAGVELFFVLSGFLITRILLESRDKPHYLRNFYARRALRIFPLYYVVLVVTLILPPPHGFGRSRTSLWYFAYLQTLPLVRGRFEASPLPHSWTLAIEEQFYCLWPFVLLLLRRGRDLAAALAVLFLGATAFRVWTIVNHSNPFAPFAIIVAQTDALGGGRPSPF